MWFFSENEKVTGKETVQYFFDPSLLVPASASDSLNVSTHGGGKGSSTINKMMKSMNDPLVLESKYLFMPCSIVKPITDTTTSTTNSNGSALTSPSKTKNNNGSSSSSTNPALFGQPYAGLTLIKTPDGTLHKILDSTKLKPLHSPHDYIGMDDVLHLPNISEASLLHTLRIRYKRDEVYTQAGQILISINPSNEKSW